MGLPLVAFDRDGKSGYLGAPIHVSVPGVVQTDFIMQEPPKHAYWDEKANQVVNLTRFDGNNVMLSKQSTASFSGTSTDETDWSIGGSVALSAGLTVKTGTDVGIIKAGTQQDLDVTAKVSYDYNQHETGYNSQFGSRTLASTGQTSSDDYLKGRMQTFDIWRYRVYGAPQNSGLNAFFEIEMPGPIVPMSGGGLTYSWYQPIHENGNILSYPRTLGNPLTSPLVPPDLGTYKLPDGSTGTGPEVPASLNSFDGTAGSLSLEYGNGVTQGGSFSSSHSLAESLDIKYAFSASVEVGGSGAAARFSAEAEVHNSNSWGSSNTSENTTTTGTKVELNKANGNVNFSYPFYPVVYTTLDGTLKMAFSVPNPGDQGSNSSGFERYAQLYGGLPDPALNLPRHFDKNPDPDQNVMGWLPNFEITRKRMRGLFLRKATLNTVTGTYDFLGRDPTAGDIVRLEVMVRFLFRFRVW